MPGSRPCFFDHHRARQRGMTSVGLGLGLSLSSGDDDDGARELRHARSAAFSWEMCMTSTQPIYYVDHNTCTTTWDDSQLPSTFDADAPQYKRDY